MYIRIIGYFIGMALVGVFFAGLAEVLGGKPSSEIKPVKAVSDPDKQCDTFNLNDTRKTKITVCQDLDKNSYPAELLWDDKRKIYILEVK